MARTLDKNTYEMVDRVLTHADKGGYTIDDLLRINAPLEPYLLQWFTAGLTKAQQSPRRLHTQNGITSIERTPTKELVTWQLWKEAVRKYELAEQSRYRLTVRQKQRLHEIQLFCLRSALHLRMSRTDRITEQLLEDGVITKPRLLLMKLTRRIRPV